jgi:hypothetical protein
LLIVRIRHAYPPLPPLPPRQVAVQLALDEKAVLSGRRLVVGYAKRPRAKVGPAPGEGAAAATVTAALSGLAGKLAAAKERAAT